MARAGPFRAHISLYQEKTNQKKPSSNGLSTLPTLSQPQCSPSLQTLHVFFLKKNFPFISLWRPSLGLTIRFSPAPRQGERSGVGGGAGWLPAPKSPPHTTTQAPESQGPSLGLAANWDTAKRWYLLLTSLPTGSHLRSGMLPEAILAVSREPSGLQAFQAPSFSFSNLF